MRRAAWSPVTPDHVTALRHCVLITPSRCSPHQLTGLASASLCTILCCTILRQYMSSILLHPNTTHHTKYSPLPPPRSLHHQLYHHQLPPSQLTEPHLSKTGPWQLTQPHHLKTPSSQAMQLYRHQNSSITSDNPTTPGSCKHNK